MTAGLAESETRAVVRPMSAASWLGLAEARRDAVVDWKRQLPTQLYCRPTSGAMSNILLKSMGYACELLISCYIKRWEVTYEDSS